VFIFRIRTVAVCRNNCHGKNFAAYNLLKDAVRTFCNARFDIQKLLIIYPQREFVLCGSKDKQGLLYDTSLTDWFS
jgi:hypothetical protein